MKKLIILCAALAVCALNAQAELSTNKTVKIRGLVKTKFSGGVTKFTEKDLLVNSTANHLQAEYFTVLTDTSVGPSADSISFQLREMTSVGVQVDRNPLTTPAIESEAASGSTDLVLLHTKGKRAKAVGDLEPADSLGALKENDGSGNDTSVALEIAAKVSGTTGADGAGPTDANISTDTDTAKTEKLTAKGFGTAVLGTGFGTAKFRMTTK